MKIGKQTIEFLNKPVVWETGSIVGPKEAKGPLRNFFDTVIQDVYYEEKTFEKAESKLLKQAVWNVLSKCSIPSSNIEYIFAGDLLNQCISSGYALRDLSIPFFGLYGACSTFVESTILAASFINAGYANKCIATTSSHFCTAERQFRMPLEQGTKMTPTGQWTVTGSGAALIAQHTQTNSGLYPVITHATPGKIVDLGIKDVANMGAAMAPAAFDTILTHFEDTGRKPDYYDMILTGDLGILGSQILVEQLQKKGIDISTNHHDCGVLIFDCEEQETHMGGSGCGCCASVFCGYIYKLLKEKKINKVLLVATGALMSPVSLGQGESIPGIAHAIAIENE